MIVGVVSLFLLGLTVAAVAGVVAAIRKSHSGAARSAPMSVGRLVVFALLFVLVVIAAIGASGLLGRLLDQGNDLAGADVSGLALSLAFALIGGPSAAILWWVLWRRIDTPEERSSVSWGLYVAGVSTVALVTATTSLMTTFSELVGGRWEPETMATAAVWGGVWGWHRMMATNAAKGPTRVTDLAPVAGSTFGLLVGAGAAVTTLVVLFDAVLDTVGSRVSTGDPLWVVVLQPLVWAVGGTAVWWWHWVHDDTRRLQTGAADTSVVLVGLVGAAALTMAGAGTTLHSLLRLAFDRTDPTIEILEPLPFAVAAWGVGALVWAFHRGVAQGRSEPTREAARLALSGLGLVATATGIGIVVNSLLDAATPGLAGAGGPGLLFAGISALVVGGPVWWLTWQPTVTVTDPERAHATGRRVYLVVVFGASAAVALVTLIVIVFRVFELVLGEVSGEGLVERIRAPFGLIVATGLVAGYHYSVWRHDRSSVAAVAAPRTIGVVTLVTGSDSQALTKAIHDATGAVVTVWPRAEPDLDGPSEEQLTHALDGVAGRHVVVVTGPGGQVDVIPLRG